MRIYHAVSSYHLLCVFVHKMLSGDDAILICADTLLSKYPNICELNTIFDKVIIYNSYWETDGEKILPRFDQYMREVLECHGIDLGSYEEIVVGGAHLLFGAYLVSHELSFSFLEDAAGLLSRKEVLLNNEEFHAPRMRFCDRMGLYDGKNRIIKRIYANVSAQTREFSLDERVVDWDVANHLFSLEKDKLFLLKRFFVGKESIYIPRNSTVFLTQHFSNLGLMSYEDNIEITQLVIDYFFSDEAIVIKPHPDDVLDYKNIIKNCQIIREIFPSEFLPVVFSNKPKRIATISSTAINNLKGYMDYCFSFDFRFQTHFRDIHKYALIVSLLTDLGAKNVEKIGLDMKLYENLHRCEDTSPIDSVKNRFIIYGESTEQEIDSKKILDNLLEARHNDVFVFLDTQKDFCFYNIDHKEIWEDIQVIRLAQKRKYSDELLIEKIYIYSKDRSIHEMINNYEYDRELKNTHMIVTKINETEFSKKISKLEGVLEATEKRLLLYIEKEKEEEKRRWK